MRDTLASDHLQLRILTLLLAAVAMVLADLMRKHEPKWLGWLAVLGALAALGNALFDPLKLS